MESWVLSAVILTLGAMVIRGDEMKAGKVEVQRAPVRVKSSRRN